ncbi:ABC transporter ATP-binding protein [Oryctes borbonicus]|uniref:ABC transporter ATP-binding protein n=1 Tax=Oryctes borbonicus TaxID=1629725 RepID=A0A0T6BFL6_9SCAR|nr:ABC transporter ATP-binding protein [Oryctes borbonicus]
MEAVLHEASCDVRHAYAAGKERAVDRLVGVPIEKSELDNKNEQHKKCNPEFSMLPTADPVDIVFEDVTYTASMGFRKGTKEILHKINGYLPQGQLIAIMGPSGAGKSTLLNVLSGYSIKGVGGNVYVNGFPRDLKAFRKLSCYITQDDRLQPLLTVEENMNIAADLKLGMEISRKKKRTIIQEILQTLGLDKAITTRASRLSGGQKKRLSIALELINNPLVLFLDEPTTGLDSSSCTQCVKLLKQLAQQGRTIICTIHQPSASMFSIFDQVYVLAAGRCLYQGTTSKLIPFLEGVQLPCPMFHNPADYVIELACGEYGEGKIDVMVDATENGKALKWFENPEALSKQKKMQQNITPPKVDNSSLEATSPLTQLNILLRRGFLKAKRDTTLTYLRIGVNFAVALMLGTLYWRAGADGSKVIDNYNLLFSILMHHMMTTMMLTILTFPTEMSILIKEQFNRWYSLKMYYLSVTIVDIPISVRP